jgi:hypothetical protein
MWSRRARCHVSYRAPLLFILDVNLGDRESGHFRHALRSRRARAHDFYIALLPSHIFIIDENFRNCELRYCRHASCVPALKVPAKMARPKHCIKEPNNDVTAYGFLDALQPCSTAQKFIKSKWKSQSNAQSDR